MLTLSIGARAQTEPFPLRDVTGLLPAPQTDRSPLVAEIREALASGRVDQARSRAEELTQREPGNFEGRLWSGLLAVRTGDTNRAIRLLRSAERGEATSAVMKVLAVAYYQARQHKLFEMKMNEASRKDPKDFAPYYYLGRYYDSDLNDFEKAAGCFTKAIQINPDHFPSYYYLGYSFEAQRQEARAEEHYQRAIAISKRAAARFHLPLMGLARLRLAAGNNEEALTFARQAVKLGDRDAAAHKLCGKVLMAMERTAEAVKEWEAAAALDSSDAAVHYQLSQAFLRLGDEQKADTALKQYKRIVAAFGR